MYTWAVAHGLFIPNACHPKPRLLRHENQLGPFPIGEHSDVGYPRIVRGNPGPHCRVPEACFCVLAISRACVTWV